MKLQIRKAQTTMGDRTFVDPMHIEIGWKHGAQGCLIVVPKQDWKQLCNIARKMKIAFKKYLEGNTK